MPTLPYYAVIFQSALKNPAPGYAEMSARMEEKASKMPGFLGMESVREEEGHGITVSYWRSREDIERWREESAHRGAQARGKQEWYSGFRIQIAKVEEERKWP